FIDLSQIQRACWLSSALQPEHTSPRGTEGQEPDSANQAPPSHSTKPPIIPGPAPRCVNSIPSQRLAQPSVVAFDRPKKRPQRLAGMAAGVYVFLDQRDGFGLYRHVTGFFPAFAMHAKGHEARAGK